MNDDRTFRDTFRPVLAALLSFLAVIIGVWVLWTIRALLSPVITALLIGYLLFPIVRAAQTFGVPRALSIATIILLLLYSLFQLVYIIVPRIQQEVKVLSAVPMPLVPDVDTTSDGLPIGDADSVPIGGETDHRYVDISPSRPVADSPEGSPAHDPDQPQSAPLAEPTANAPNFIHSIQTIHAQLQSYGIVRGEVKLAQADIVKTIQHWITDSRAVLFRSGADIAVRSGQFLLIFVFVLVFTLLDGDRLYHFIVGLAPNAYLETTIFILNKTEQILGAYLRGVAVETVLLFLVALTMLGIASLFTKLTVTLALVLAVIIALTNIVRIIGPIFGGFISVLIVALTQPDIPTMVTVTIIAILVQIVDNVAVLPLVMQDQVDIHPLVTMVGIFAGGIVAGVLGMVMAIPVIAGFKVLYRVIVVEIKRLDSDNSEDLADLWSSGRVLHLHRDEIP